MLKTGMVNQGCYLEHFEYHLRTRMVSKIKEVPVGKNLQKKKLRKKDTNTPKMPGHPPLEAVLIKPTEGMATLPYCVI